MLMLKDFWAAIKHNNFEVSYLFSSLLSTFVGIFYSNYLNGVLFEL
jgi:hypothetical protein